MSKSLSKFPIMLTIAFLILAGSVCAGDQDVDSYLSLEILKSSGDDWEVTDLSISPATGNIRVRHDNWLMYFLHWRSLDSIKGEFSIEYAKNHLLNFWGDDMPFVLTDVSGTTTVAGHEAFFVEGTIYEGRIKTRFYVWNCEETNRQFTSDCNINLSLGTAEKNLELQFDITSTICCHDGCTAHELAALPQPYSSDEFKLSFDIPSDWRIHQFEASKWFPDGASLSDGSLWTLLTNSQKTIELHWSENSWPISTEGLKKSLDELIVDSSMALESPGVTSFDIDTVYSADGRVWAEGTLKWLEAFDSLMYTDDCTFIATMWTKAGHDYLMLLDVHQTHEVWGRKIDLAPSRETMQRFLRDVAIPSIRQY